MTLTELPASAAKRAPAPPAGLRVRGPGRALWSSVTRRYALRLDELRTLEVACRTADEMELIDAALQDASPVVAGAHGRQVANPLLEEARRHRTVYLRALAALGLGDAEVSSESRERSGAGRALARQRWAGRG